MQHITKQVLHPQWKFL